MNKIKLPAILRQSDQSKLQAADSDSSGLTDMIDIITTTKSGTKPLFAIGAGEYETIGEELIRDVSSKQAS